MSEPDYSWFWCDYGPWRQSEEGGSWHMTVTEHPCDLVRGVTREDVLRECFPDWPKYVRHYVEGEE